MFHFNLQQVLNLREQKEESRELEFAQAKRRLEQEEERLTFFKNRRDRCQRELLEHERQGVSQEEIALYGPYMEFLKSKIQLQIELVASARNQMEKKKAELLDARKDRKILERLRSKRYQIFMTESGRREMKQLDEVALGGFYQRAPEKRG